MTRRVALPPVPWQTMPEVWAQVCTDRGPVACLEAIEAAADRAEVDGYPREAASLRRDAAFFADSHA